jgi:hypothetical protein
VLRLPDFASGDVCEVRVLGGHALEPGFDLAQRGDVLHGAFFARCHDDAPLGAAAGRHVDERAQAFVGAEPTARLFAARRPIRDAPDSVEADEGRGAIGPRANHADRLESRADSPCLAGVLVHHDLRLRAGAGEGRADEIDLRFDGRQIPLRAALKDEPRTQTREVRNARDVEEDVLGQHGGETRKDLLARPPLPLECDDVGLQEDGAAVAEARHGARGERRFGVTLHRHAERLRRRLKEVAVARRALRVESEVLDAAVLQEDQFDVLSADVDDDVGIAIFPLRRFGVRHGFGDRDIRPEHVVQDVLRVAGGAGASDLDARAVALDRCAQLRNDVDGILYRVAERQAVRLREHRAVFAEQDAFGRRRARVEPQEHAHPLTRGEARLRKRRRRVPLDERVALALGRDEARQSRLVAVLFARAADQRRQRFRSLVLSDVLAFEPAELNRAQRGEVLGQRRGGDQIAQRGAFRHGDAAVPPHLGDAQPPRLTQPADKRVRSAEQQHVRQQRVSARQH